MFNRSELKKLIFPLIIEQLLGLTIGMIDTVMVASVGEAAVSSISLVDSINILLINIFAALATGGAIVSSQYIGREDVRSANIAAKQLLLVVAVLSSAIMALCLMFRAPLLRALFGVIEDDVMANCRTYFFWTALSYPFIAIYNGGAALFRSMGNSRVSMATSVLINIINLCGNAVLIYGLHLGVAGAAIPTFVSRAVGAVAIMVLLRNPAHLIHIDHFFHLDFRPQMVKNILMIGIPNGLENGMFQIGKIMVQGLVASLGTVSIAANAVCNSICSLTQIPGVAIGLAMVTIVGQCVGAERFDEAKRYALRLTGITYLAMAALNLLLFFAAVPVVSIFQLTPETAALATQILHSFCFLCMLLWPSAFTLPNALRAAGDVRYTMLVSIFSMWAFRIGLSYIFARNLGMGLMGVWMAMYVDWGFRILFFVPRLLRGRWMKSRLAA